MHMYRLTEHGARPQDTMALRQLSTTKFENCKIHPPACRLITSIRVDMSNVFTFQFFSHVVRPGMTPAIRPGMAHGTPPVISAIVNPKIIPDTTPVTNHILSGIAFLHFARAQTRTSQLATPQAHGAGPKLDASFLKHMNRSTVSEFCPCTIKNKS